MNIVAQLQELDALIIEHTRPPITAILRNNLSVALEQAEAHADAVSRQDQTLAAQAEEIQRLMAENKQLIAAQAEAERRRLDDLDDALRAELKKQSEARKRRELHYD